MQQQLIPLFTSSHPVTVTSSRITSAQVTKTTPAGQQKKIPDKGKAKPLGKMKKNVAKTTPNTTDGPSVDCQLRDKAKHTAALIQEITEELQVIEEESSQEDHNSETQENDLEQEDSDYALMEGEQ